MRFFMKNTLFLLSLISFLSVSCSSSQNRDQTIEEKKAEVYYNQGTNELVNKNYQRALTSLLQAKELNPKESKIRNNLGMAYYFREQFALAEEELKTAIKLDEKNSDARLNLGSLYMTKNRLKEARVQFEKVTTDLTFPNQYRTYYNLAILSLAEGDRRQAFVQLEKSIKEKDDYCTAHYKLGELYSEEYRFKQALDSFREAGKGTCVNEPSPLYQQALALLNLNRTGEAKKKFQEVMEKFSSSRFSTLASVQLKKINNNEQPTVEARETEVIRESQEAESPNF
jgi:Tfp pilus assembly protein PilF